MDSQRKKCSSNKHSNIDAIFYCKECKKYFCNKCQNFHSDFFEKHTLINLEKDDPDNIFIDICKEQNHPNKLDFYCKNHNVLCCAACCMKLKDDIYGKHKDCDVCFIKDIKVEKKNKLKENINLLEEMSKNFEKNLNELKNLYEKIIANKEELKLNIQKIFTKIRNSLNEKEDKLLLEVDEKYNEIFLKEDLIKQTEKLPNKIKISLEIGKKLNEDWNENNLSAKISECINVENNIKDLDKLKNNVDKIHSDINKEIIYDLDEKKINEFLEKITNLGNIMIKDNDLYNNFDIQSKNSIFTLNNHSKWVYCLTVMNDGRLASGSGDSSIIIYNKDTYKPDIIIKEHNKYVVCIIQLSSGLLASCSTDKTIKLFNIKINTYEIIQTLSFHTNEVYKIIELKNKSIVSCSYDKSIIFYIKDNIEFKKDFTISTDNPSYCIIQTKNNEICYSDNNKSIFFFDFIEKKIKASISNINKSNNCYREWFLIMKEYLLLIPGSNNISIVNINEYRLIRVVNVPNSGDIHGICSLNENMILTSDSSQNIKQWKIEGDNLNFISEKKNAHNGDINFLLNLENGHIASGSDDCTIKIW